MYKPTYPAWTVGQVITPEMAADACDFFGLYLEAAIYRTPGMCQPFVFDGCSFVNNFLKAILYPEHYDEITQEDCRPHDLIYGVCRSSRRRLWGDNRFKKGMLGRHFIQERHAIAAWYMVRKFGTSCSKWGPGFALKPEYRVEVK